MAPNLAASQRNLIHDMIISKSFTARQIADAAGYSIRGVKPFRLNMRFFGTMKAPWNGGGRPRSITPSMLEALREHLVEKPDQYLDEMVLYLWDEFKISASTSGVSRALKSIGWSKKTCHLVAKGRNADLRDYYMYQLSSFRSYQLVYVDESGWTSGLDLDGQVGLRSERHLSR